MRPSYAIQGFDDSRRTTEVSAGDAQPAGTVLRRIERHQPVCTKQITVVLNDEGGNRIERMRVRILRTFTGTCQRLSCSGVVGVDTAGSHLFVAPDADRLEVSTDCPGWYGYRHSVEARGSQDRTIEITVPETCRQSPLSGRILDSEGKHVPEVKVSLCGRDGLMGPFMLGLSAVADDGGRFEFDYATNDCLIRLDRYAPDGFRSTLPGWQDGPVAVTAAQRKVEIRLKQAGGLKVLLPTGFRSMDGFVARPKTGEWLGTEWYTGSVYLAHDVESSAVTARWLGPGTYCLGASTSQRKLDTSALETVIFDVKAGEETVVDLRQSPELLPRNIPVTWTELKVTHAGEPVSGAVVSLDESLSDLTNDAGQVRFETTVGKRYVAVARVYGRLIGWAEFTSAEGRDVHLKCVDAVSIETRLNKELTDDRPSRGHRRAMVTFPTLSGEARVGLFRGLHLASTRWRWGVRVAEEQTDEDGTDGKEPFGVLRRDGPLVWLAEDLPVGIPVVVSVDTGVLYTDPLVQRETVLRPDHGPVHTLVLDTAAKGE